MSSENRIELIEMISLSLQAFLQLLVCNRSSQNTILQKKILHSAIHIKIVLGDAWAKKSNCCRNKNYSAGNLQKHPKALRLHSLSSQTSLHSQWQDCFLLYCAWYSLNLMPWDWLILIHLLSFWDKWYPSASVFASWSIPYYRILVSAVLWEITGDYMKEYIISQG